MLFNFSNLDSESQRLLHGRGGFFPGLEHVAIDWFAPVVLVTFYAEKENNEKLLTTLIKEAEKNSDIHVLVTQDRHFLKSPNRTLLLARPSKNGRKHKQQSSEPKMVNLILHYYSFRT